MNAVCSACPTLTRPTFKIVIYRRWVHEGSFQRLIREKIVKLLAKISDAVR